MTLPSNTPPGSTPAGTAANIASSTPAPGANVPGAPVEPSGFERVDTFATDARAASDHSDMLNRDAGAVSSSDVARIVPRETSEPTIADHAAAIARHETDRLPHVGDANNPTDDGHGVLPESTHPAMKVPPGAQIESGTAGEMAKLRLEMREWWRRVESREGALAADLKGEIKRLHDWLTNRLNTHTDNGGKIDPPQS